MQTLSTLEFLTRLAVGLGCGALIGAERQWRARRAGLRTNAPVAAGATLFVLYSDVDGSANSTQLQAEERAAHPRPDRAGNQRQ
jgi:putative Mg2+ transporter-C (MgtC) family protein